VPREQGTYPSLTSSHDDREPRESQTRLTPAQEHALRRSAPLTPTQYEELRRLSEQGGNPLRRF
jgi:hypothetical protein